jgi:hypothetical protein
MAYPPRQTPISPFFHGRGVAYEGMYRQKT